MLHHLAEGLPSVRDKTSSQPTFNTLRLPTTMYQESFTNILNSDMDGMDMAIGMAIALFPSTLSPVPGTSSTFQPHTSGTALTELISSPTSTPVTLAGVLNRGKRRLSTTRKTDIALPGAIFGQWGFPALTKVPLPPCSPAHLSSPLIGTQARVSSL